MAVRAISRNMIEMTENGDKILDVIRVDSVLARTTTDSGDVVLSTNIVKLTNVHGALEEKSAADLATDEAPFWEGSAMNANETRESAISLGDAYGVRVSMPPGASVILFIN